MPGIASLGQSLLSRLGERKSVAALFEYDDQDKITAKGIQFQYFPETITDTKAVNYQTRDIPGGSLPLYQWISSGERILSFLAFFSADVDLGAGPTTTSIGQLLSQGPLSFINFGGSASYTKLKAVGQLSRNVDVRTACLALRRYMFPHYQTSGAVAVGSPLTLAPKKLMLTVSAGGLGVMGGATSKVLSGAARPTSLGSSAQDSVNCIMTQCDISWEAWFPSGVPRIASVQLSFAQLAQLGGAVDFPAVGDAIDSIIDEGDADTRPSALAPYPFRVKFT